MLALIDQKECNRYKLEKLTNQTYRSNHLLCKYCQILPTCYKLFCSAVKVARIITVQSGKHLKTYNHLVYQLDEGQP